tara:strand:- start:1288 stop:2346 length:1059 start_codon:yes stop_codon:yes gene_type:complete
MKYGADAFSVYNHMYMPISFKGTLEDYNNLVNGVQLWDVACERQVEIKGPDAESLSQFLTPRDIKKCSKGQAMYAPFLDFKGGFINDPVMLKIDEDHYWFSLADGDSLLWAQGIAAGYNYDVEITEPDVSPLQVQGPNSTKLMAKVFGDWVNELSFYKFRELTYEGIPMVIARMGYSRERCYEIFLRDHSKGDELWEMLWQAGQDLDISAGTPNIILRLEGGILSYLADMDRTNNPYEVGLDWLVDLDQRDDFIGKEALREIHLQGPTKKLIGAEIQGKPITVFNDEHWPVLIDNKKVGSMHALVYSPRLKKNIGYIIVDVAYARSGSEIIISSPEQELTATVVDIPWFERT